MVGSFLRSFALLVLAFTISYGLQLGAQTVISGTYNGTTITTDISLANSTSATFTGGTTFTGANATFGTYSTLNWQQPGALTGKTLTFGTGASVRVNGTNNALTLGSGTTATGQVQIYSDSSSGTALTNQGIITHNSGGGALYAATFSNSGTITASSGSYLDIGYYYSNYTSTNASGGKIIADGANTSVYLNGNVVNQGTLVAQNSGQLVFRTGYTGAPQTTANLGTIQIATGGHVYFDGTLDNTSATLAAPTGGSFELHGGTINNGSVASGALSFTNYGGTLSNVSLAGDLVLPANASVYLTGGATFAGTVATLANYANVQWQEIATLTGKTLTFGPGSYFRIVGANNALTLAPSTTATGQVQIYSDSSAGTSLTNQGIITHNSSGGVLYAATFSNSGSITASSGSYLDIGSYYSNYSSTNAAGGSITADGSNTAIYLNGNVVNQGTLTAQNSGQLVFRTGYTSSPQTTANLGTIQIATGGHVYFDGTLDNTSATLAAPTGGSFELHGGTINNGSVASGALSFTNYGGTLNNVSLLGNVALPASSSVYFTNGTSFAGSTATLGNYSNLQWQQTGSLTGKTLTFGTGSYLRIVGANNTLTLAPDTTATGQVQIYSDGSSGTALTTQGTITNNSGGGALYANTFSNTGSITASNGSYLEIGYYYSNLSSTNAAGGSITADGANTAIYLNGNLVNLGTLTAQNSGQLVFRTGYTASPQTTANLGTIQIATGGHVYFDGTLDNTSATLPAPTGGSFELHGGTINNGSVASGALSFTNYGGTLNNVALLGNVTLPASSSVYFTNGTSFSGSAATFGNYSSLKWQQTGTLDNKTLTFGTGSSLQITGANHTLTLGAATTATGQVQIYSDSSSGTALTNLGTLTNNSSGGTLYAATFSNRGNITASNGSYLDIGNYYSARSSTNAAGGTITADGANTAVYLNGNFVNQGTLIAQNSGQLIFRTGYTSSPQTTANLGTVQIASGGHAYLNGTLDNTGATLTAPTGGSFELYGGTINNGTIASGALSFTNYGGTLSNVSLATNLTLPASSYVYFTGGTALSGGNSAFSLGDYSRLYWQQTGTLAGKALTFGNGAALQIVGTNNTFTLGSTSSATGTVSIYSDGSSGIALTNAGTITHTSGSGQIYAPALTNSGSITANGGSSLYLGQYYSTAYSANNTGVITADGVNTGIYFYGDFINSGTLRAQNSGQLFFNNGYAGTTLSSHLGTVEIASGGHAYLSGTIDNTSATLAAPTGGAFELYGGTILGGTVAANALSFTSSGGTLNGVTVSGGVTLPASSYVRLTNATTLAGSALTLGNYAGIQWDQSGTLTNTTLTFGAGSYFNVLGANHTLTITANTTLTGDVELGSDTSTGVAIVNQGNITHTTGGGGAYAQTFTNTGSIVASGGSFSIGTGSTGSTFDNANGGVVRVTGGASVYLTAPGTTQVTNNGTIDVQNGTFNTLGHLVNGVTGRLSGSGTISGNVTISGGTISPGNSIGTLTFSSGTFTVTNPATLAIELGGTSSDQLVFNYPPSAVNIGTGLLTLSLTLLAPPTDNTTYDLIRVNTYATTGVTGTFANLPTSGSIISATYGGTSYAFSVNYQTNLISLNFTAVPEPSTYAMLGAGLLVVGFVHQRRRSMSRTRRA